MAMTAGAGLLTLSDAISKYLMEHDPIGQVICLRQAAAFMFLLPYAWVIGGPRALRAVNYRGQMLRAALFITGVVLVLQSLHRLPLAFVTVVLFSSPLFVALLSAPLLRERVGMHQWIAIAAGFVGIVLIVQPAGGAFSWIVLLPVLCASMNATRDVVTRLLSRTDSSLSMLFWSGLVTLLAGLMTLPFGWNAVGFEGALWYIAAGLTNVGAHFLVIEAFRLGNAAVVAPFRYSGLLWAMLLGFLVWGDIPTASMVAGALIVIGAGVYMLRKR
jgi:drug/metabolite transporter (DMT)-like permease